MCFKFKIELIVYPILQESRVQFSVNMTEKVTKLLEVSRNAFGAWREHEAVWSSRQYESLNKMLGNKILLGDAPLDLYEVHFDQI